MKSFSLKNIIVEILEDIISNGVFFQDGISFLSIMSILGVGVVLPPWPWRFAVRHLAFICYSVLFSIKFFLKLLSEIVQVLSSLCT